MYLSNVKFNQLFNAKSVFLDTEKLHRVDIVDFETNPSSLCSMSLSIKVIELPTMVLTKISKAIEQYYLYNILIISKYSD